MSVTIDPQPLDEDLAAAVLAAIALYLAAEEEQAADQHRPAWQAAALVTPQGITPAPGVGRSGWASADRAGRMAHWSGGMLGCFD